MPPYAIFVTRMTSASASTRSTGLAHLRNVIFSQSAEGKLAIVNEPGLLTALNSFLSGGETLTALSMLGKLTLGVTPSAERCRSGVFASPCFASIKDIAATSSTLELEKEAWRVIAAVSGLEEERTKEVFDSPGMVPLLMSGLKRANNHIAEYATITIHNLSINETTASAVLDDHPRLVQALVDTFRTSGVCQKFQGGCGALFNMTQTTERAILVLSRHPNLVTDVQSTTANVSDYAVNREALRWGRVLVLCLPAGVQQAAATRRVVFLRRFAIMRSVSAAQRKKYGEGGQATPVTEFLEALADVPGDVLQEIVKFVGVEAEETVMEQRITRMERGNSRRMKEHRKESEAQRLVNEGQGREIEAQRKKIEALEREIEKLKGG